MGKGTHGRATAFAAKIAAVTALLYLFLGIRSDHGKNPEQRKPSAENKPWHIWNTKAAIVSAVIGLIGLVLALFSINGSVDYSTTQCLQAEHLVAQVGKEISPLFPEYFCKAPNDVTWPNVRDQVIEATGVIKSCFSWHPWRAKGLRGKVLLLQAMIERQKPNNRERYDYFKSMAEKDLGTDSSLILLRNIEDHINNFEYLSPPEDATCKSHEDGKKWLAEIQSADDLFVELGRKQLERPSSQLLGCLWMFRGEQSYYQAGACGEEINPRRVQAVIEYRYASHLGGQLSALIADIAYALQTGKKNESKAGLSEKVKQLVVSDAARLGDQGIVDWMTPRLGDALEPFLGDQRAKLEWLRSILATLARNESDNLDVTRQLADLLIHLKQPKEALEALDGSTLASKNSDFAYLVLRGKALCFSGRFEEALPFLKRASPRDGYPESNRWGFASLVDSLCSAAAGQLTPAGLESQFEQRLNAQEADNNRDSALTNICESLHEAELLGAAIRRRGAGGFLANLEKRCPAP